MSKILNQWNQLKKSEGMDFCRYLCLHVPTQKKKAGYFQAVADFLHEFPGYNLYLISEKELQWLAQFRKDGMSAEPDQISRRVVAYAMVLGLVEVRYREENGWKLAGLAFTDALDDVIKLDGEATTKKLYGRLR